MSASTMPVDPSAADAGRSDDVRPLEPGRLPPPRGSSGSSALPSGAPLPAAPGGNPRASAKLAEARRRVNWLLGENPPAGPLGRHRAVVRHPEVRKTLEQASDRLREIDDVPLQPGAGADELDSLLGEHDWLLADGGPSQPTAEQAWLLADALRGLWLRNASDGTLVPYVAKHPLTEAASAGGTLAPADVREWLVSDHADRRRRGVHERAKAALRARYLSRVGGILWLLVAAAVGVGSAVSDDPGGLVLTVLAGAIGGTLSGARALRENADVRRTRGFQAWWWVQPAVGASVGLLIYALLSSPVLALPGSEAAGEWERIAAFVVYAFAAGFSEPFVLGVLSKITGAVDATAEAAAEPPSAGTAVASTTREPASRTP